ncbi:MAG: hypothetical protein RLN83_00675 [Balneola sp.]
MNKEKEFSVEYTLKWGAVIGRFTRYGLLPIISLVWVLTVIIVDFNRNTIVDILIVTSLFLLIIFLAFIENFKKERITINNGCMTLEALGLFKKGKWKYDLQELDRIKIIPKEYMWNKIYGKENPSYVRYKLTFRYKEKDIFFADGLDHKTAFSVLSKMKESEILEEKLNQKSSL